MSPTASKDDLLARAYGPDAEPLTPEGLVLLHPDQTRPIPASPSRKTPPAHLRTRAVIAISLFALTAGVVAGYFYDRSEGPQRDTTTDLSDGIVLQDGSFRSFNDANCYPALDPDTGALATVTCTWKDETSVTLDPNGITSPNVLGTTTREPQADYWIR